MTPKPNSDILFFERVKWQNSDGDYSNIIISLSINIFAMFFLWRLVQRLTTVGDVAATENKADVVMQFKLQRRSSDQRSAEARQY